MTHASKRVCGSCTACCTYFPIKSLGKAQLTKCPHLAQVEGDGYTGWSCGANCMVYGDHPTVCGDYSCLWLYGYRTDEDRPDRCGVLIDTMRPLGNTIQCKPLRKGAADTREGQTAINRMSRESNKPALVLGFTETHIARVVGRGSVDGPRRLPTLRACDGCTECCTYYEVKPLQKAAHEPCKHLLDGACSIYEDENKPKLCDDYLCLWAKGYGDEQDRPDRSEILADLSPPIAGSIRCKPVRNGAADSIAGRTAIARLSKHTGKPALVAGYPKARMTHAVGRGVL